MKKQNKYRELIRKTDFIVAISLRLQERGMTISEASPIAKDIGTKVLKAQERKGLKKKRK